jgi:hypothetical protein
MGKSDIPEMFGDITFWSTPPKVASPNIWVPYFLHTSGKCMGKATTQHVRDTTLGGVDPKVISPNMSGMSLFPYIFSGCTEESVSLEDFGGCHFGSTPPKVISPNIRVVDFYAPHLTGTVGDRITWRAR